MPYPLDYLALDEHSSTSRTGLGTAAGLSEGGVGVSQTLGVFSHALGVSQLHAGSARAEGDRDGSGGPQGPHLPAGLVLGGFLPVAPAALGENAGAPKPTGRPLPSSLFGISSALHKIRDFLHKQLPVVSVWVPLALCLGVTPVLRDHTWCWGWGWVILEQGHCSDPCGIPLDTRR